MHPQDFEDFALGVLQTVYGGAGIEIIHTRYVRDAGRDGEGTFPAHAALPDDLQVRIKLWVEAKQRSGKVGPYDVGRHLFAAFCHGATKIVFVTNRDFTQGVRREIQDFCYKANIQYGLISGQRLLELASAAMIETKFEKTDDRAPITNSCAVPLSVSVSGSLTRQVHAPGAQQHEKIVIGEPFFLILDVSIVGSGEVTHFTLSDDSAATPKLQIIPYGQLPTPPFRDGDNVRIRYTLWAQSAGRIDLGRFTVSADGLPLLKITSNRSFEAEQPLLPPFSFASQSEQIGALERGVDRWLQAGKFEFLALIGPAGYGKTHLLQHLRTRWLSHGVEDLVLEGADIRDEAAFVSGLFDHVVPLPPDQLREAQIPSLRHWLITAGITFERADSLARAIVNGCVDGNASMRVLADVVHVLIASLSKTQPFVIVFEDLHQASHGVLEILCETMSLMKRRQPNCLVMIVSRDSSADGDIGRRETWRVACDALLSACTPVELGRPSDDDAYAFLSASVLGFEKPLAKRVVAQVGSTPFGLREGLLYMKSLGIVKNDETLGLLMLRRPQDLDTRLETEEFKAVTANRLRLLRSGNDEWLARLLDAAACLGRRFDIDLCRSVAGVPNGRATRAVIETCRRENVIRPAYTRSGAYEFDHDLIRIATLRIMTRADRIETAQHLLQCESQQLDLRTQTLLTYLAAQPADFIRHAERYAAERSAHHRFVDAAEALALAVVVADPDAHAPTLRRSIATAFDDAAGEAEVPLLQQRLPRAHVIDLVWSALQALSPVSSGSSKAEEDLITYAELIARRERDVGRQAALITRRGAMLLERGFADQAYIAHQQAETLFAALHPGERETWREAHSLNLVQLAIACRHTNRKGDSLQLLTDLLRTLSDSDNILRKRCLSNLGALGFYDDPQRCRSFWEEALDVCRGANDIPGQIHMLLDLTDLDIADGRDEEAFQRLRTARDMAEELELDNELLRSHVFGAVLALAAGDFSVAAACLNDAIERGVARSIGRRMWKCWTNLATLAEAHGNLAEAYLQDIRSIESLPMPEAVLEQELTLEHWPDARIAVAFGNVALRARTSAWHQALLDQQPSVLQDAGKLLATVGDGNTLTGPIARLGGYLRGIRGQRRFLAT